MEHFFKYLAKECELLKEFIKLSFFRNEFHMVGARYFNELIPKVLVIILGINRPSLETFLVKYLLNSLFNLNKFDKLSGKFLFLKSNTNFII